MSTLGGVGLINTNLVFGYDIGNHRLYPGEPTTNLLSGEVNTIPKIGNGWGTYNTNQYNGAQYFSIGTISSITNNIITTSGNHPLRSYDVVTPQTTGGGLTAGTNYLIKKLSNTTFSIHSYNSSQDGSQGYINPSTGTYKVYDDFANDVRVSVNTSSFPTMWWGPPHLPNSGLVKEIIPNGFVNPLTGEKTDCIRMHVHRADGVADHMAYGVDAGFTPNQIVCCSFWAKAVDWGAVGKSINYYHYTYGQTSATAYAMDAILGSVGEWKRYSYTFTSPNSAAISYWFNPGGPYKYDIANIQIEHKNHATPYTSSSRGVTNTLTDKKRKYTFNVTNTSFDNNGFLYFNGTNNKIEGSWPSEYSVADNTTPRTWEIVVKPTSTQSTSGLWGHKVGTGCSYFCNGGLFIWSGNYAFNWYDNVSYQFLDSGIAATSNQYVHVVGTYGSDSKPRIYVNGELKATFGTTTNLNYGGSMAVYDIGWNSKDGGQHYFNGEIPIVRFYKGTALSPSEVQQNYKAYKRRFNIS